MPVETKALLESLPVTRWRVAGHEQVLHPKTARPIKIELATRWNAELECWQAMLGHACLFEGRSVDDAIQAAREFFRELFSPAKALRRLAGSREA